MAWPWQVAQWVAPQPKAAAPPPMPVVQPHENNLTYRSEKRRKLQEHTLKVIKEPWNVSDSIIDMQEDCFHEYETTIENLSSKLRLRDNCIYEQKQNISCITKQLHFKNNQLKKKNNECILSKNINSTLQCQIESLSLQLATEASEHEEKIAHYKSVVQGLQKTAANAEESSQYIRYISKLLFEYQSGESLDDSLKSSNRTCSICMDSSANIVCSPCMHMEFCYGCVSDMLKLSSNDFSTNKRCSVEMKCPRCKSSVNEIMYVFT